MAITISPRKRYILRALELSKTDAQIGQLMPDNSLREKALAEGLSLDEVIGTFLEGYAERPVFGERSYQVVADSASGKKVKKYLPSYSTISYGELHERIKAIAMVFRTMATCQVNRGEFGIIMGFADIDFVTLDLAFAYSKAVRVPVQSSSSGADLHEIVENIQPVVMASTIEDLPLAVELAMSQNSVKSIIVFNYDERVDAERAIVEQAKKEIATSNGTRHLFTISELIEIGKQHTFSHLPNDQNEAEKPTAIIHSSGSTGKPKGAVIAQKAFIYRWVGKKTAAPKVSVLLAPLNHMMGRLNLMGTLNCGGTGYFTLKPDLSTLLEDIRLARPTYLSLFPRIFELIHQHFQNEVAGRLKNSSENKGTIEKAVMQQMRHIYLGDRLKIIVFGSAPTSKKVQIFMRDCFDVLMLEGYGNTESGTASLTMDNKIVREVVLDYKLRDVPELGYFTTDKPFPRGELIVKTKYGIKEYYKQPEATAALFDENGYSCTGDIVEEIAPDEIRVIDRRKDVLKLSHGEYVATGTLGTIYEAGSAVVKQIYVYGNSKRSYLLAVVVPELEVVHQQLGTAPTAAQVKNLIRDELNQVAQKEELKKFEVPRNLILEYEPFTQENGLLSSVRKRLRPALKRKYGAALEGMYEAHENAQDARVEALKGADSTLTNLEKLIVLLENQLNIEGIEADLPRNFNELGGDSLGAALYAMSIEEIFGVNMAADVILSPTGNLKTWEKYIDEAQNPNSLQQTSFEAVHGKGATKVSADDLQLEHFIAKEILNTASNLPPASDTPKTVLLTGANGFLGHIVCLQWLKILAPIGGKLICLIRENSDATAYEKLAKEYQGLDAELEETFYELSKNHLEVLAGDISRPSLGLSQENYHRLSANVDRICHVAALVNHRLAYQHLFRPNVVGTAEIIKMAISTTQKPIDFISTVGVFMLLDSSSGIHENVPFRKEIALSDSYANGYAVSKWGGEILLQELNQRFGNPVNIFRCDMILPDQHYKGQANTSDMLTRLLYSMLLTGLAPQSFYQNNGTDLSPIAHYEGVPVDVLAKAITGVGTQTHQECKTYHAINYLKDAVSLDSFVDWIETAGYPINRIASHEEWHQRMETKLRTLPEEQRQLSALEVLLAYRRPHRGGYSQIGADNFKALVESLNNLGSLPHLSEKYIHKYLKDIAQVNNFNFS